MKKNLVIIGCLVLLVAGFLWQKSQNTDTVAEITQVTQKEHTQEVMTNRTSEPIIIEWVAGEATQPRLRVGQRILLKQTKTGWQYQGVQREKTIWLVIFLFALLVLLLGRQKGAAALLSLGGNLLVTYGFVVSYDQLRTVPLLPLTFGVCCLYTLLTMLLLNGWNRKTWIAVVATLSSTFLAFGVTWLIMTLTNDQGLRYEEMQFLTRPYRTIFLASLLIGTLGAAMDVAMTVVAAMFEAAKQELSAKQMLVVGRNVGKDVMGTMANVLLLAYISSSLPILLLYLRNGWQFFTTIQLHLSLELTRALVGALGIVLTIPVTLLLTSFFWRKRVKL